MKKLASILILVFAVTFTTQAQKKRGQKAPKLTTEQQATLKVKKLALALDLDGKQQREIMPLISQQIATMKAGFEARKAMRKADKKPTSDEIFAMQNKRLDHQIMMKNKMKKILNPAQFEKFEKIADRKKRMIGKKMKEERGKKGKRKNRRGDRDERGDK